MKVTCFTLTALAAALFLVLPSGVARASDDGASPSSASTQPEPKKKGGAAASVPFRGHVGSVDSAAKTVTLAGKKKERVLHVTEQSRIERDGKPAALGDIKPGDFARGSVSKDAEGREVLLKATFGDPPAEAAQSGGAAPDTALNGR